MLDLSIKQLTAKYNTPEKLLAFMQSGSITEQKSDGVKVSLIKIANLGGPEDWLVSYKGNVLYSGEFDYQDYLGRRVSYGASQFGIIFEHLEALYDSESSRLKLFEIPVKTELLIEFIMQKHTVLSEYTNIGEMVLIGYSLSDPIVAFGKIERSEQSENTAKARVEFTNRDLYADILNIRTPQVLINGRWHPADEFAKSATLNSNAQDIAELRTLESTPLEYFNKVSSLILQTPSVFGGAEEGAVIRTQDGLFKIQQDYQFDTDARIAKKMKFIADDKAQEQAYWQDVISIASQIASNIKTQDIKTGMHEISLAVSMIPTAGTHPKKNAETVKDDIQHHAKNLFLRGLVGNDNSLVIGKFRIFTNGHHKMLARAVQESDEVVIGLVRNAEVTEQQLKVRKRMLNKMFPNLRIIELKSGNLFTAIAKAGVNINRIYAGSDRIKDYVRMTLKTPGVEIIETARDESSISASKIIENIDDVAYFEENTPTPIHRYRQEIIDAGI